MSIVSVQNRARCGCLSPVIVWFGCATRRFRGRRHRLHFRHNRRGHLRSGYWRLRCDDRLHDRGRCLRGDHRLHDRRCCLHDWGRCLRNNRGRRLRGSRSRVRRHGARLLRRGRVHLKATEVREPVAAILAEGAAPNNEEELAITAEAVVVVGEDTAADIRRARRERAVVVEEATVEDAVIEDASVDEVPVDAVEPVVEVPVADEAATERATIQPVAGDAIGCARRDDAAVDEVPVDAVEGSG